jgi:hypothetical protein
MITQFQQFGVNNSQYQIFENQLLSANYYLAVHPALKVDIHC